MKTKTVYCLRMRPDDNSNWSEPEYYKTRKRRDNAASYCRCLGGFRTHSYEEKLPIEEAEIACA